MNFIYTVDPACKSQLEKAGYQLITQNSSGAWVFANKTKDKILDFDQKDILYTNTLSF